MIKKIFRNKKILKAGGELFTSAILMGVGSKTLEKGFETMKKGGAVNVAAGLTVATIATIPLGATAALSSSAYKNAAEGYKEILNDFVDVNDIDEETIIDIE